MKRYLLSLSILLTLTACKNSNLTNEEKERIKQKKLDSIAEVKFNELSKDEVDTFPLFSELCSDSLTKQEQKKCFEDSFVKLLQQKLQKEKLEATAPIDKILVDIKVDTSEEITLVDLKDAEKVVELLATPKESFKDILIMHLNSISKENPIVPATKQGLEVSTQFTIPIVVNVK